MRNLKRALSLTLASVMLLGMMVVGSSAAGFPDVTEEDNVEAIEVLKAVEVMVGDDNGNFGPNDPVNRSQMAVVMAKLLNLDYQYYESSCIFWDVPTWARGYVGACYAKGIVSGYGSTTYGAADTVTAVQAASMMMRALGYFQHAEDYKGSFELATVSQGTDIGIFDGVGSSATAPMTRNQVARMALNALESEMVTFTGTPGVTIGDATVGYRAEYTPRTSTELKYTAIENRTSDVSGGNNLNRGQYYIQLGEELYNGKLTKKYARDDFERPSINWQYDGKEIGTYVDYELKKAEYTTGVTGAEMYDLLTYTTINDNDLLNYVDGVEGSVVKTDLARSNKNDLKGTGTGVLTEVFVDQSRDEVTITSINTYLAKANSDYNKNNETLSLKVYQSNKDGATKIVDSADVPEVVDVTKDQFVLVYMSGKDNSRNYNVVKMFDVEILGDSTVTKFTKDAAPKVVSKLTTGGTEYKTNPKAFYDCGAVLDEYDQQLLTNMSYNIYLDRYGNAIGVDLYEGNRNYVFITGYDRIHSNIAVKTADAAAIFLDGTMDVVTVNVTDTNKYIEKVEGANANYVQWGANDNTNGVRDLNRWYTYTVNNNGTYTLKPVERFFYTRYQEFDANNIQIPIPANASKILNSANLYVDDSRPTDSVDKTYTNKGRAYGNDNSIYITVEPGKVDYVNNENSGNRQGSNDILDAITDVKGVYTGIQNVKIELNENTQEEINFRKNSDTSNWSITEQDAYVYTVYDSDHYIVASVVLGDAQGSAANYAYILGDAKSEEVKVEDGSNVYYWEFDAVVNGEQQTLTARTKYSSVFSGLKAFHVQELRFDGDYVTSIKDVAGGKIHTDNTTEKDIDRMDVYDVGHCLASYAFGKATDTHANAISEDYALSNRIDGTIYLEGRTLYAERDKGDVGLALATDAKAVLVQYEDDKRVVTSGINVSEAVGRLADADTEIENGTQFQGRIVAVLKNGIAQWVVIISDTNLETGKKPGYGGGNVTVTFRPGDYSDERNVFYVGNDKLVYPDDFKQVDRVYDSFRAGSNELVQIVRSRGTNTAFGYGSYNWFKIGEYDDNGEAVYGYITDNGYVLNFRASRSCTLFSDRNFTGYVMAESKTTKDFPANMTVRNDYAPVSGNTATFYLAPSGRAFTLPLNDGWTYPVTYKVNSTTSAEQTAIAKCDGKVLTVTVDLTGYADNDRYSNIPVYFTGIGEGIDPGIPTEKGFLTVNVTGEATLTLDGKAFAAGNKTEVAAGEHVLAVEAAEDTTVKIDGEEASSKTITVAKDADVVVNVTVTANGGGENDKEIGSVNVTVGAIPAIGGTLPTAEVPTVEGATVTATWGNATVAEENVLTINVELAEGYKLPAGFAPTVNSKDEGIAAGAEANTWTYTVAGVPGVETTEKAVTITDGKGTVDGLEAGKNYSLTVTGTVAEGGNIVANGWYHVKVGALDGAVKATGTSLVIPAPLAAAAVQYPIAVEALEVAGMNGTTQVKYYGSNEAGEAVLKFMDIIGAKTRMARTVVVTPGAMAVGDPWVITIGEGETAKTIYTAVRSDGEGGFEIPLGYQWGDFKKILAEIEPNEDGFKPMTDSYDEGLGIKVDGEAIVTDGEITAWSFTMGKQPTVGAKLPSEVVLDQGLTLKIDWVPADGVAKESVTYTPTFTPAAGNVPLAENGVDVAISVEMGRDPEVDSVEKTEIKGLDPAGKVIVDENGKAIGKVARNITATVNPVDYTATFAESGLETGAEVEDLDVYDVVDALNNSTWAKGLKITFSAGGVDLAGKTALSDTKPAYTVTWDDAAPAKLVKVTYPTTGGAAKTVEVSSNGTIEVKDIDRTVLFLMKDEGKPYATTGVITVANRTATLQAGDDKDVTYVAAVKLDDGADTKVSANGEVNNGKTSSDKKQYLVASIGNTETSGQVLLGSNNMTHVKVGAVIQFIQNESDKPTANSTVVLKVNDKAVENYAVDKDQKLTGGFFTVENSTNGVLKITADEGEAVTAEIPVVIGSNKTPVAKNADGTYDFTGMKDLTLVYYDAVAKKYVKATTNEKPGANGTLTMSSLHAGAKTTVDGVETYQFFRAYSVLSKDEDVTLWTAYTAMDGNDVDAETMIGKDSGSDEEYIPVDAANRTIYVKVKAGTTLYAKDDETLSPLTGGDKVLDKTGKTSIIYTVTVDKNITKDSYDALVTFADGGAKAEHSSAINAPSAPNTSTETKVNVTGLTIAEGVTVKATSVKVTNKHANVSNIAVALNSAGTGIELTVTTTAGVTQGAKDTTLGTVTFELSTGDTVQVDVVLTGSGSGH